MILKNKCHALNKRYSKSEFDHEKEKLTLNNDNEQGNATLEICIQRLFEPNLFLIDLFVIFQRKSESSILTSKNKKIKHVTINQDD